MGERLQNCNGVTTVWSSPPASIFQVTGVDANGIPNVAALPGMQMQAGVDSKKCQPYKAGNPPTGTLLQSAHAGIVNVLGGDGKVRSFPANFDPKSLNYYCVGLGRDQWVGTKYTPFP